LETIYDKIKLLSTREIFCQKLAAVCIRMLQVRKNLVAKLFAVKTLLFFTVFSWKYKLQMVGKNI